jgi:restriction system protein
MACPDFQSLTLPLLHVAASGDAQPVSALRPQVAKRMQLTEADLAERIPSGRQSRFSNRVAWASIYLAQAGLLEKVSRGTYRITSRGREVLTRPPERIDVAFMSQYPEFRAWVARSNKSEENAAAPAVATPVAEDAGTPEEHIEAGYTALRGSVETELLTKILAASPSFFENLVVELLVAMGYGGSRADAGQALGRSGDGGLDGIIKEDKLGLDAIFIQAKRWDPTKHKVSRPDVQAFAGSLEGARARKGVFITTSTFSGEAHDYVARIEKKIILIDGPHLAALLFDHGVGVRTKDTYEIKEVDEEYFLDD